MGLVFLALLFFGAAVYDKIYAYKANRDYEKYRDDMRRKGFKLWRLWNKLNYQQHQSIRNFN